MNLQGVVNNASLEDLLRRISQDRKQGVLQLHQGESTTVLSFHKGKIFEIVSHGVPPVAEVLAWLKQSGIVRETFSSQADSYASLMGELANASLLEEDDSCFTRVIHARIREKFHSLHFTQDTPYVFTPQATSPEDRFSPSFAVSTLLVERAEFLEELPRRKELFSGESVFVVDLDKKLELNEVSQAVFSVLDGITPLSQVPLLACACRFDVYRTLEALRERGALTPVGESSAEDEELDLDAIDDLSSLFSDAQTEENDEQDISLEETNGVITVDEATEDVTSTPPQANVEETSEASSTSPNTPHLSAWQVYNGRLLSGSFLPHLFSSLILLAIFLLPLLFWTDMWSSF